MRKISLSSVRSADIRRELSRRSATEVAPGKFTSLDQLHKYMEDASVNEGVEWGDEDKLAYGPVKGILEFHDMEPEDAGYDSWEDVEGVVDGLDTGTMSWGQTVEDVTRGWGDGSEKGILDAANEYFIDLKKVDWKKYSPLKKKKSS